jgi:hypothetical protein
MIFELFPSSAGALPSKLMYQEEASSTLIVALMFEHTRTRNLFNDDYQLIVNLFLNPNCEGARADVALATICNKSITLIDVLSSEGDFSVPANFGNTDSEGDGLCRPLSPHCITGSPSILSYPTFPKHSFTSAKFLQYFVREIGRM